MNESKPASILDWFRAPSPQDKKEACGRVTQIVEYTNGTVGVMAFYCHRWDCPTCEANRREEIKRQISSARSFWFMKVIDDMKYSAVAKRVKRAGAKYCALGRGENVLMLTTRKVFEDSSSVYGEKLSRLIDLFLESCPYAYRRRKFRHSKDLFLKKGTSITPVHIKRKIAVMKSREYILASLEDNGYLITNREGDVAYMRPISSKEEALESALEKDKEMVVWVE